MIFLLSGRMERAYFIFGASALSLGYAGTVYAQQSDRPAAEHYGLDEIVVTATRQQLNVQDVPIPINAMDSEKLEQTGVKSVSDLQFVAPGLKVANVSGYARITLRGVGTNGLSPTAESGVANYLDGVFVGNAYYQSRAFFDLERIEILRGPQGTLYGRNATGGAINVVSNAPSENLRGGASVSIGNYDLIETEGFLSGPIAGDKLRARIAYNAVWRDGYTPNSAGKAQDDADAFAIRGRLVYQPVENFSVDLGVDYSRDRSVGTVVAERANPLRPLIYEILGGNLPAGRRIAQDVEGASDIRSGGIRGTLNWDMGSAKLMSITAYREAHGDTLSDFDFTDLPFASAQSTLDTHQFTQDIYLVSAPGTKFEWTVGASYFHEATSTSIFVDAQTGSISLSSPKLRTDAYAVYGEGTYNFTPELSLSAGLRYTHEKKSFSEADVFSGIFSPIAPLPLAVNLGPFSDSWNKLTPRASLAYRPNKDLMFYAAYSRGFKAGGFNSLSSQTSSFDPEDSTNYEVGIKSEWLDRRLRLNLSAFWMDYVGLQVQQRIIIPPSPLAVLIIDNAASSRVKGIELELSATPAHGLSVDGNLAYLDARYRKYDAIDELAASGSPLVPVNGNRLSGAPRWSGNLGIQYNFAIGGAGSVTLRGDYAYQSKIYNNGTNAEILSQDAASIFNTRVSFETQDGHWHLSGWIRNLTDKKIAGIRSAGAMDPFGGQPILSYYLPPRTYGLTIGYTF
jgi:iron complex outermembrane receptor protein